ncbi:efflux RND transporter periplasmic adaptor subunit [Nonomuraea jabiensis]|uniref:HlyD family secretion protein n=1 Tax=Nonomuraea jabiensis TaxID=882448 RepID=A0A7W9GA91_9ACTN|nr:efflux RND transporter periplasmic adaptor subunit [Nonomuraea jabiensis]MBB5780061.1 HlyD family secretion protein [Nonomuraea jabiensis]
MRPTFALGGLALAVLVAGSGLALALRDDAPPAVQVRLASAQRGQVTATVSAAGNTVDGSRRDLAFGSSGTLTKVYVKVGTKVKKGQVLARIDGRSAREAYTAAKADLAAAEEALEESQEKAASPAGVASPATCTPSGGGATPATSATGGTPTGSATPTGGTPGGSATPARGATPTGSATPTGRPSGVVGVVGTGANGALGPAAPSPRGVSLDNGSPATSSTPHPTSTPTSVPTDPGPTGPGPEPQPTVTVTVTATATVTTTVTATPTGGASHGGIPGGGSDQSGSRPASDATPSATSSGKPSTSAKPSTSGRPTAGGKPSSRPSTRPTGAAARPNSQSSCNRGTDSAGQGQPQAQGQGQGQGQGGVSEEQASANVDRAQAALEQAADAVRATRIVAPAAGTVLSLAGAVGDQAGTGTFVSLGDLNELQVQAMVTESDVNRLKLGQKARITLATRNGQQYEGTVTAIAPTATVSGQLVRYSVTLAFDEPPAGLMLGQTASVTVTTDTAANAIYVPASAVRSRSDGAQVVTVRAGGRDSAKVVRTGVRGDQYVEVTSGLEESDEVVMSGATNGEFPDASWPGA